MKIGLQSYDKLNLNHNLNNFKKKLEERESIPRREQVKQQVSLDKDNDNDNKLKLLANEFTSIMLKEMFKSMRNTIPEEKLIDGGFGEDVFTDMLDTEYSKSAVEVDGFNSLSRVLYQQLKHRGVR